MEIKCAKCENENITGKMHWIKRWVYTISFGGEASEELPSPDLLISYGRNEMIRGITEDVENGINEGEQIVCDNCFKDM